jgi:lysozyme
MSPGKGYIVMMIGFEGERHSPYLDSAGKTTIGIGSRQYENGEFVTMKDPPIDHDRAIQLLFNKTLPNQRLINHYFPDGTLNQNQNDALLSLVYNIGAANFQTSSVLRLALKDPNDPNIRQAFWLFDKEHVDGKLVENEGLLARRKLEADIYFS